MGSHTQTEATGSQTLTTDVLIVGAGPAGLTLSALLARAGTPGVTVARHAATAHTPRAHITNQRTMEVLRDLGIESQAQAAGHGFRDELPNIVWAESFAGREIARVRARGAGPERLGDYALASPCQPWNISQNHLEPIQLTAARNAGADIRFRHELTTLRDEGDWVEVTIVRSGFDGRPVEPITCRARWLVAADGANSTVARLGGFEMEGKLDVRRAVNVWTKVDLAEFCARRPGNIYGIHQPGRDAWMGAGLWVNVSPWDEWVVSRFIDGDEDREPDEADAVRWLEECIGVPAPIEIKGIGSWSIHEAVAKEYKRGRVILMGDAAHRHPPVNGLGTNTAIQDAYNLAWKLTLVVGGSADERLLDSYEEERRPVGQQVVKRAWESARNSARLGEAVGMATKQDEPGAPMSLDEMWAPGVAGRRHREALREALRDTRFQFNAQGVELGQIYRSSAVVGAPEPSSAPARDPELFYDPSSEPGRCLPHVWLEHREHAISTLDVPASVGLTLIVGVEGQDWVEAAAAVANERGVPITAAVIGYRQEFDDVYGDWQDVRGVGDDGCLLVRPDRFIAWRSPARSTDPVANLGEVVRRVLGLVAPAPVGATPPSAHKTRAGSSDR